MTKSQVIDKIMASTRKEVEEFMAIEGQIQSGLEYEDKLIELSRSFAHKLMAGGKDIKRKGKNSKKNY